MAVSRRTVWRCLFAACAVLAAGVLAGRGATGLKIETDLMGLVSGPAAEGVRELSAGRARTGQILLEGTDVGQLKERADALASKLGQQVSVNLPATLKKLKGCLGGLLSPATRAQLVAGRTDAVAQEAMARLFGPVPPFFSVKDDPFLLATDYVMSLQTNLAEGWALQDGYPVRTLQDRSFLLFSITEGVTDPQAVEIVKSAQQFNAEHEGEKIWCCGPLFHSATAMSHSKAEINILSTLSLALVILFGWLLFRSFRFVGPLFFTVASSFLFATAALLGVYPHAHVLTFVFGTSLIGLSVDYVYHSQIAGGAQRVVRPLTAALATTLASFAPLLFGDVAVLRQMALFTMAGLVGAYASVFVLKGRRGAYASTKEVRRAQARRFGRLHNLMVLILIAVLIIGGVRARGWHPMVSHDATVFYRPNAFLAESEKKLAALNPAATTRFAYVKGATLEEALVREERAGLKGLSALVPSLARQRENLALVARLIAAEGSNYTSKTGLKMPPVQKMGTDPRKGTPKMGTDPGPETGTDPRTGVPEMGTDPRSEAPKMGTDPRKGTPKMGTDPRTGGPEMGTDPRSEAPEMGTDPLLNPENFEKDGLDRLIRQFRAKHGLLAPCGADFASSDPNIIVIEPRRTVERLFDWFFVSTLKLLGWSALVLVVFLAVIFRRRFLARVLPVVGALVLTLGALAQFRVPISFFTLLCAFVLIGLGLDYSIFHDSVSSLQTKRAVWYSFLTSLAGLGLLAFTDFPVTRAMGQTFAFGLFFAYVCSLRVWPRGAGGRAGRAPRPGGGAGGRVWYQQREQSAGRLRLLILWWVYRLLGKNILKLCVVPVFACIYPFARPARAALAKYYAVLGVRRSAFRHLLAFAWSLVDKLDACTLKRDLPRMTVREDADARDFFNLLDSGRGAFLISTHVGTIEVLPALARAVGAQRVPHVHAFQQLGHDAEFTKVFLSHFDTAACTLHAVEAIGVETAVEMLQAIARGDCVLMAGDRVSAGSGKTLAHDFLGRPCVWPKGVFAFAKLMEAPVFFVTCVRTGWNAYEVRVRAATRTDSVQGLLAEYVPFLEEESHAHPEQWYQFYDFFAHP